jgi:hypothetical protein
MKAYGGVEVWLHTFLTSVLYGGEWSTSCPDRFTRRKRAPVPVELETGPRVGLDAVAKEVFVPLPGIEPWSSNP